MPHFDCFGCYLVQLIDYGGTQIGIGPEQHFFVICTQWSSHAQWGKVTYSHTQWRKDRIRIRMRLEHLAGQHFLLCVPTDPVMHCLFSYYWTAGPVKALPLMRDLAVVGGSVLGLPRTIKIISSRLFLITNPTNYYLKKEKSNWFHERAQNERSYYITKWVLSQKIYFALNLRF